MCLLYMFSASTPSPLFGRISNFFFVANTYWWHEISSAICFVMVVSVGVVVGRVVRVCLSI